jgi:hypothetical protein
MFAAATNNDVNPADGVVAPKLPGGVMLPFPPTPSGSIAGRTLQESTYAPRVTPPRLHADSPNIVDRAHRRRRAGAADDIRR